MHPPAQTNRAARHEANRLARTRSQSAARSFGPDDAVQEFSTIGQLLSCRVCVLDVLHAPSSSSQPRSVSRRQCEHAVQHDPSTSRRTSDTNSDRGGAATAQRVRPSSIVHTDRERGRHGCGERVAPRGTDWLRHRLPLGAGRHCAGILSRPTKWAAHRDARVSRPGLGGVARASASFSAHSARSCCRGG